MTSVDEFGDSEESELRALAEELIYNQENHYQIIIYSRAQIHKRP